MTAGLVTLEDIKNSVPKKFKNTVTQELVDRLNGIIQDPYEAKHIRDNLISYSSVLDGGKFDVGEYINASMYVSYKLMGLSNTQAYIKTFPDRYKDMCAKGYSSSMMAGYVGAYNKTKLVNLIREQSLVPTWILNADAYQEAINTQVELMREAKSERVRAMAADSILNHLKRPDAIANAVINVDVKSSGLEELKESLLKLAKEQKELIKQGTLTPKQIVELEVIDAEPVKEE